MSYPCHSVPYSAPSDPPCSSLTIGNKKTLADRKTVGKGLVCCLERLYLYLLWRVFACGAWSAGRNIPPLFGRGGTREWLPVVDTLNEAACRLSRSIRFESRVPSPFCIQDSFTVTEKKCGRHGTKLIPDYLAVTA